MTIDTPRGPFVLGRVLLPAPGPVSIARALAMAEWAAEQGNHEAEAFYAGRAAELQRRVVESAP